MSTNLTFLYFWRLMTTNEIYMHRCLELAQLGAGSVAPNPMVGAVLVHDERIIGEGYHQQYGKAHAEPNCIASVTTDDKHLIEQSTLYVSLEPCAHFGKTPPCADLIVAMKIPKVVIGCRDPFVQVNGKGIEKLKAAGVEVELGVLEKECKELNKRFFAFHTQHRPYVILKWAQTLDGKIGPHLTSPNGVRTHTQPLLKEDSLQSQNEFSAEEFYWEADLLTYKLLKNFVSENRAKPTEAEDFLWQQLRGNKLNYSFRRQHIIGNFIVDFVCLAKKLVIEVDGLIHQLPENRISDEERTMWLGLKGYSVIRFSNEEILFDIENTLNKIRQKLNELPFAPKKNFESSKKENLNINEETSVSEASVLLSPVGGVGGGRLLISNEHTNRLVHKWRSNEMAIAVGTNTALFDDPELTTRLSPGQNPIRIVVDMDLRLPKTLKLFNSKTPTIVFNIKEHTLPLEKISIEELRQIGTGYYQVTEDVSVVHQMMHALYRMNIQSVLIEGGSYLLQSFIDEEMWDEARVITNEQLSIGGGLAAPILKNEILQSLEQFFSDVVRTYQNTNTNS
jgi:riboflavin-specific deaminase-like protein